MAIHDLREFYKLKVRNRKELNKIWLRFESLKQKQPVYSEDLFNGKRPEAVNFIIQKRALIAYLSENNLLTVDTLDFILHSLRNSNYNDLSFFQPRVFFIILGTLAVPAYNAMIGRELHDFKTAFDVLLSLVSISFSAFILYSLTIAFKQILQNTCTPTQKIINDELIVLISDIRADESVLQKK